MKRRLTHHAEEIIRDAKNLAGNRQASHVVLFDVLQALSSDSRGSVPKEILKYFGFAKDHSNDVTVSSEWHLCTSIVDLSDLVIRAEDEARQRGGLFAGPTELLLALLCDEYRADMDRCLAPYNLTAAQLRTEVLSLIGMNH